MSRFNDVNVTVTGAAGVLGMAVAQAFQDEGAIVSGIDVVASGYTISATSS